MKTNDPIWDAEKAQEETRKPIAYCHFCKEPIFGEDASHYGDEAYYDNDIWWCGDCKQLYLDQFKVCSGY